jgi:hypothetical protein
MPSVNTLMLDNAELADVAARLADLDPAERYEVTIRRTRSRAEIAADMLRLSDSVSRRVKAEGMTANQLAEILEMSEAERRNLLD